jgi:hypothetical protein
MFADNAYSAGDFTAEWTSSRHTITPLEGPLRGRAIKLSGVWELSGMGFAREGVNLIFSADGSGQAVKITKGRENPNEISMKLDPLTFQNVVEPAVCPRNGRAFRFNYVFQQVDPAGVATFERSWTGCVSTGTDSDTPSDNAMGDTFKFKPTRRG